jgi:DNA-binding winged helix-turn-helix (wHTH) protein
MSQTTIRRFSGFQLDLSTLELMREGRRVPLQPQPARVLAALVAQPGTLVSRDELRAAIWGDATFVDFDRGLNYCVRHLRAALGDVARRPRFIETVARRGYRFVATVSEAQPVLASVRRERAFAAALLLAAAAVVTLVVESGGRNQAHHDAAVAVARAVHDFIF